MPRVALLLTAVMGIALCLTYIFQPYGSIDYVKFEPCFMASVGKAGLQIIEENSGGEGYAPLPLNVRLRQHLHFQKNGITCVTGFPNLTVHYKLASPNSPPIDCYVRYLDRRATVIAIRSSISQISLALSFRTALAKEFPDLAISLIPY